MSNHTLIIDGNNLAAINTHAHSSLSDRKGRHTGGTYGTIKQIRSMLLGPLSDYDFDRIFFAVDAGRPEFRMKLCPDYKGNRAKRKDDGFVEKYRETMKMLPRFLKPLGITIATIPGWEADDVIAYETMTIPRPFVVCSGDKDLLQLTRQKNVHVYQPVQGDIIRKVPRGYVLRRCFEGDSSDNIKGVDGIGPVRAAAIIGDLPKGVSTVSKLFEFFEDGDNCADLPVLTKYAGKIAENEKILRRNWKMMSLRYGFMQLKKQQLQPTYETGMLDMAEFDRMCRRHGFVSIRAELKQFFGFFKGIRDAAQ